MNLAIYKCLLITQLDNLNLYELGESFKYYEISRDANSILFLYLKMKFVAYKYYNMIFHDIH